MAETRRLVIEVDISPDDAYLRDAANACCDAMNHRKTEASMDDTSGEGPGWRWRIVEGVDTQCWKARFEAEQREHAEEWGRRLELERRFAETTEPLVRHSLVNPCEAGKGPLEQDAATMLIDDITCVDCMRIWGRSKVDERYAKLGPVEVLDHEVMHGEWSGYSDPKGAVCGGVGPKTVFLGHVTCLECLREFVRHAREQYQGDFERLRTLHADALAAQRVALQSRRKTKQARRRSQRCAETLDKALAAEDLAQLELERIESAFLGETRGMA